MPILYRPACAQDLERADQLVVSSINDLTQRHGFGPMAAPHPPNFQLFSLKDDASGLWIAEEADEILGFAWSWVCGDLWFLAQLFVSPGHQGRGIGNELLNEHLNMHGIGRYQQGADHFHLQQRIARTLYSTRTIPAISDLLFQCLRANMLMGLPRARAIPTYPDRGDRVGPEEAAEIDARVLGVSREKHHRYLINESTTRGVGLYASEDCIGYAYVSSSGHIGPLAVLRPDALATAFRTALALAAESGASKISAFLPGASETALSIAVEHGMRITFPMLLMSTRDFGDWTGYLPRNPGFM